MKTKDPVTELYISTFGPLTVIIAVLNLYLVYCWWGKDIPTIALGLAIAFFATCYALIGSATLKLIRYRRKHIQK